MLYKLLRGFSAMLFRMVPKLDRIVSWHRRCFSAMLFRMVPKHQ